ncbi:MAG: CBASS cGAMP-activated phospholipase [Pseudomonadota bacterium]
MSRESNGSQRAEPRSAGVASSRRVPSPWPRDRDFRVLAIDGGGIRGLFPADVLAALEQRFLAGRSIAEYFDLIVGTSTGGIVALGLAAGLPARELRDLYRDRGREIFPPSGVGWLGAVRHWLKDRSRLIRYSYDSAALERVLYEVLGDRKLGDARTRLCIPSFEGEYGEVFVFKTPHHPAFKKDLYAQMVKVALATAAAPTYFRPHRDGGYTFVDGGIWANNPIMVGLTEALTSFDVSRDRIRILSFGCGNDPYRITAGKIIMGGMWHWRDIIVAAMQLQSQSALGQAGLLIGPENLLRIDIPKTVPPIALDDWRAAVTKLPSAALQAVERHGSSVAQMFLSEKALQYEPVYWLPQEDRLAAD